MCIINCNRPWRNLAPVAVPPDGPPVDPAGPDLDSDAVLDVTEPPGCVVAIDVSDEFAAFPCEIKWKLSLIFVIFVYSSY